jgi:hypothetical protein
LKKIDAVKKHKRLTSLINRNGTLRGIGFGANIGPMLKTVIEM